MAKLPTPSFYLIANTSDFVRMGLGEVSGGSEYKIFRSELPDYSDEVELYYGVPNLFEDADVLPDTTYYYRALALANGPGTEDSEYATLTVTTPASNPLNTPVLTLIATDKFFTRWQISPVTGAYQYIIERSLDNTFVVTDTFLSEDPSWEDGSAQPSTLYYYRTRAVPYPGNGFTYSDWSDIVSATTTSYPPLPTPTLAASEITANSVKLTLSGVAGGINYNIQRSTDPLFGSSVNVYFGPAGIYVDQPLIGDKVYHYRSYASATTNNNQSPFSDSINIETLKTTTPEPPEDTLIPGLKYKMDFRDVLGKDFRVNMHFKGWSGGVTMLTGGPEPVIINISGSDDDVFYPVRDTKATVNVLMPSFSGSFYDDITQVDDKTCWVEIIDVGDNFKYTGWLIPDEHHRSFDETMYEISLTIVSPFSVMRGVEILQGDGKMLFGTYSIAQIIERCLSASVHESIAKVYEIDSNLIEATYTDTLDLFNQLRIWIEGFNDSNGRPPKCYDFIEKLCMSFGFYCMWENNVLKFVDNYSTSRTPKEIKIKDIPDKSNFLISNTESITKKRATKELSLKINYGKLIGLLYNGRFLYFTNSTSLFPGWSLYPAYRDSLLVKQFDINNVTRTGTGRQVNPYRMRIKNECAIGEHIISGAEPWFQGVNNIAHLKKGDNISARIGFKYFNYRAAYDLPVSTQVPYLAASIQLIPDGDSNFTATRFVHDVTDPEGGDVAAGFAQTQAYKGVSQPGIMAPLRILNSYESPAFLIGVESIDEIQYYERQWGKMPFDGILSINFYGLVWYNGKPAGVTNLDQVIDLTEVIITKSRQNFKITGEQLYLTQFGDISKIEETKEVFFGSFDYTDVSGALLKNDNTASTALTRSGASDRLQNLVARSIMAQQRTPRQKLDCSFRSNDTRMSDMLVFKEGTQNLLPNKYMIGKYDYNVKHCEVNVTAHEIHIQERPYTMAGENFEYPTLSSDMLETYQVTD